MSERLIQYFVMEKDNGDERLRRLHCGRLSGGVGILLNTILGLMKVFVGLATGSVAVIADAVNNLSDAAASIITLIGFSLADRKSDAEHPFGHARYEYMTGVVVSVMVTIVGFQLITASYEKVIHPTPIQTSPALMILLIVFILVKLWIYHLNMKLSALIKSVPLKATAVDSRNDAIMTAASIGVMLLNTYAKVNIDGYVGLGVGVFIIVSGIGMVKENVAPLLGQGPSPEMVRKITGFVLARKGVLGIHDLIVHDYGPRHIFASVHIEVDSRDNIFTSHALIDEIEKEVHEQLQIQLVGHMDPLDTQNPKVKELSEALSKTLTEIAGIKSFHDLRIIVGPVHTNVIFDVVAAHEGTDQIFKQAEKAAQETLTKIDPKYIAVINRDLDYGVHMEKQEQANRGQAQTSKGEEE